MPPRLKFAVNARALRSPITGIGRYLRGLMREVERADRFAPDYFCSLRWGRSLDLAPLRGAGPGAGGRMPQMLRSLRPLVRTVERINFASGLRWRDFAFYFEPAYLPFATPLPTVITIHDLSHLRHPETHPADRVRELERGLPAAIKRADRILTVSDFTRREVIDVFGVDPDRIVTTPLGVEPRFFPRNRNETARLLTELRLTHRQYFLAVGTLEPRKNILTTVAAHARLPARIRNAYPLVVAGMTGWRTHAITRGLEAAQSRGDVRLLGHVGDDLLPLLYGGAAMLSYPSIYEGFGLPPLEAMACGAPVITTNNSSLPEVVGDAALIVDAHDVDAIANAMLQVASDPSARENLRQRGLARAKFFTWRRTAEQTLAVYEKALG